MTDTQALKLTGATLVRVTVAGAETLAVEAVSGKNATGLITDAILKTLP